jgi:hypothetical protein
MKYNLNNGLRIMVTILELLNHGLETANGNANLRETLTLIMNDKCKVLLLKLEYSTLDERNGLPARHSIPINGIIRTGTATFKQALKLYISFLQNEYTKAISSAQIVHKNDQSYRMKVKENKPVIDSYVLFLQYFNMDNTDFYNFGIKNTVLADNSIANTQWEGLKNKLLSNQKLAIRGYGRQGVNTALYLELYEYPRRNIQSATGYAINKNIFNYQCSHVIRIRYCLKPCGIFA